MFKSIFSASIFLIASNSAFAAKAHREAAKDFEPKAKSAAEEIKSGCGCAPSMAWDVKSFDATPADKVSDYKSNIMKEFEDLAKTAKEFCGDAASKKLFCANVKKIVVSCRGASESETKYEKGSKTITVFTSKDMSSGGYKMKSIMEEW